MSDERNSLESYAELPSNWMVSAALSIAAAGYVLFGTYPPSALAGVISLIFIGYLVLRVTVFWENNRFTPTFSRVGLTWALVGYNPSSQEFDYRPVRIYFILLSLLFCGLILRPLLQFFLVQEVAF